MRRFLIGTAGLLVGVGLELGDFRSRFISQACLVIAAVCYVWLLLTWRPLAARLPKVRLEWPRSGANDATQRARLEKMRKVLLEAAQSFRGSSTPNDIDAAVDDGVRHYNLLTFLSQGFAHHVKPDFDAFMRSEEEKSGDAPSTLDGPTKTHERVARYLENLARRLRTADLDDGFLIPDHWSQYDSWKWPKNTYS